MNYFPWLYLCFVYLISCIGDKQVTPLRKPYISFEVDSIRTYSSDSVYLSSFIFSPIEEQNRIWVLGMGKIYDVDLLDSNWILLGTKYPALNLPNTDLSGIWKDTSREELFIAPSNQAKIFHYNIRDVTMNEYQLSGITTCINITHELIVGTSKGLFIINKDSKQIKPADKVPLDLWINNLEIKGKDSILINDGSAFLIMNLEIPVKWSRPGQQDDQTAWNFIRKLPEHDKFNYHPFRGEQFYLYASTERVFFSDTSQFLYEIDFLPNEDIYSFQSDDKYWYILYPHQFVIVNRQYALRKAKIFDFRSYNANMELCRRKIYELSKLSITDFIREVQVVSADTSCQKLDDFNDQVNKAIYYYLSYAAFNNTDELNELYSTKRIPPNLEKYAIIAWIKYYIHRFDEDKVKELMARISSQYHEFEVDGSQFILPCFDKIFYSVDSLRALKLPHDEYLFKEAKIKEKLVTCGWFGDNYYDLTLRDENYDRILREFPKSPYAEEIEFYHAGMEDRDEDSGYPNSMAGLKSLDQFLRKYPNSRFEPRIQMEKAEIMSYYTGDLDSMIWYKERALEELKKINPKFLQDSTLKKEVEMQFYYLEEELIKTTFDFTLTLSDRDISQGETITISTKLFNKSSQSRPIRVFATKPYFSVYVSPESDVEFQPGRNALDTTTTLIIIPHGEFIEDVVQFPGVARRLSFPNGAELGALGLSKEGQFYFGSFGPDYQKLSSNRVSAYFHK